jgi:putative ABC transport system permease protein
MMLLVSAGLVARSLVRLLSVNPGFDDTHLVTLEVNSVGPAYSRSDAIFAYRDRVQQAVRSLPGVTDVALTNQLPLSGQEDMYGILDPENIPANPELSPSADRYSVSPEYLTTMRVPLLRGRIFTAVDGADSVHMVTVISAGLSNALWPGENAIGKRIRTGGVKGVDRTVIGVVGDVRHAGLDATVSRQFYVPERQWIADNQDNLVVRTSGDPVAMIPTIRKAVAPIDANQPITWIVTMDQMISRSTAQRRLALVLFGTFAVAALLLAMAGIYGVLAGTVAERTREIGVRSALGATPANIVALVVGQGGRMTAIGLGIGVIGSLAATRFLRSLLFSVGPSDPATLGAVVALLATTTIAACIIPAQRAARVEPSRALRSD